jgi:hypothetical protein
MTKNLKIALAATLLLGSVSAGAGSANAAGIGFRIGDVSIGYSDGYYDTHHRWHRWARHEDMDAWRQAHAEGYHDWRHDDRRHHD